MWKINILLHIFIYQRGINNKRVKIQDNAFVLCKVCTEKKLTVQKTEAVFFTHVVQEVSKEILFYRSMWYFRNKLIYMNPQIDAKVKDKSENWFSILHSVRRDIQVSSVKIKPMEPRS